MKNTFRSWVMAAFGAAAAIAVSSCAYDPYYSSVGGYYDSGYGYGHGYGGSSFSTSFFVSTGDPRWGYDPYTYSYYDYHRRAYYDPYLYGYYPVGYRPPVIIGVPHPHGWRRGHSRIAPPSRVRDTRLSSYRDRAGSYRSTNYSWARQVRPQAAPDRGQVRPGSDRIRESHQSRGGSSQPTWGQDRISPQRGGSRPDTTRGGYTAPIDRTRDSSGRGPRVPSAYNTPVQRSFEPQQRPEIRPSRVQGSLSQRPQPPPVMRPEVRTPRPETRRSAPPEAAPAPAPRQLQRSDESRSEPRGSGGGSRGQRMRGLGEG